MGVNVGGVELAVEEHGAGMPVVLLHGFPLSSRMWEAIVPALTQVGRVVTVDLRGFGDSEAPQSGYSMDALAGDVMGVAAALHLDRWVLAGHSMGGYVALRVAARWPERLAGLMLVDTRAEPDDAAGRQRREQAMARLRGGERGAFLDEFVANLVAAGARQRAPRLLEELRSMAEAVPVHVLIACLEGMRDRPDSRGLLPTLAVPTLVLVGEEDSITPPGTARAMAEALPKGRLVVIPEAGHTPPLERPVATAEAMLAFLAGEVLGAGT